MTLPPADPLRGLASALISVGEVDQVVEVILREGSRATRSNMALLALPDESGRRLRLIAGATVPADFVTRWTNVDLSESLPLIEALRTGRPVLLEDHTLHDRRFARLEPDFDKMGIRASATLPLGSTGGPLGTLTFLWKQPQRFEDDTTKLLGTIAEWSGLALEQATRRRFGDRLVSSFRRDLDELALDVEGVEVAGGYQAAWSGSPLGGDWYDAFGLPDDRVAVVVGDVGGHGVGAAPDMIVFRQLVRALMADGIDPADCLARFDRVLTELSVGIRAATVSVLVAIIDPHGETLTWANGGLPTPLLRRASGTIERLEGGRVRILSSELEERVVTRSATLPFEPGAMLVAYTDGLQGGRPRPAHGEREALEVAVSQHGDDDPLDDLIAQLLHRDEDQELRSDDVAVLAARSRLRERGTVPDFSRR